MMTFSTLSKSDCDVEGCDGFGFPECQFMAVDWIWQRRSSLRKAGGGVNFCPMLVIRKPIEYLTSSTK